MELWTVTLRRISNTFTYFYHSVVDCVSFIMYHSNVTSLIHFQKPVSLPMFTDTSYMWYVIISLWLPVWPESYLNVFPFWRSPTHAHSPAHIGGTFGVGMHGMTTVCSGNVLALENYKNVQCQGVSVMQLFMLIHQPVVQFVTYHNLYKSWNIRHSLQDSQNSRLHSKVGNSEKNNAWKTGYLSTRVIDLSVVISWLGWYKIW
jgi:hypothetical protein